MAARIRSLRNGGTPVNELSRNDLVATDVVTVSSLDAATTYAWTLVFAPAGSAAVFSGSATAVSPGTFTVDLAGPYLVRLTVDAGLGTEDTQHVRLRVVTTRLGLLLVAAGERRDESGVIPVDASAVGWANDQNANLQALEAAFTLQKVYEGGASIVLTNAATPITVRAGAAGVSLLTTFLKSTGVDLGGFRQPATNTFRLWSADGVGANPGNNLDIRAGDATAGVQVGGNIVLHPGAGFGGGATGKVLFENSSSHQVAFAVTAAGVFNFDTVAGGLALAYNANTGLLTVPGVVNPTAVTFTETATTPTTSGTQGALFLSNGAGPLDANTLYFVPASNGTPVPLGGSVSRETFLASAFTFGAGISTVTVANTPNSVTSLAGVAELCRNGVADLTRVSVAPAATGEWRLNGTSLEVFGDITASGDTYRVVYPY